METRGPDPPTIPMQAEEEGVEVEVEVGVVVVAVAEEVVVPRTEATSGRTTTTREARIPVNVERREHQAAATTLVWRLLPRDSVRGSRSPFLCSSSSSSSSRTLASSSSRVGRSRHLADRQKQKKNAKKSSDSIAVHDGGDEALLDGSLCVCVCVCLGVCVRVRVTCWLKSAVLPSDG